MLKEKLQELGKKLQEWQYALSRDTSPEKMAEQVKEMKRDIEKFVSNWRYDIEQPLEKLTSQLEETKRIISRY